MSPLSLTGLELVALLAEGVDRNRKKAFANDIEMEVALLAEGVDRNLPMSTDCCMYRVALLAEGVDRNFLCQVILGHFQRRPPRGGRG